MFQAPWTGSCLDGSIGVCWFRQSLTGGNQEILSPLHSTSATQKVHSRVWVPARHSINIYRVLTMCQTLFQRIDISWNKTKISVLKELIFLHGVERRVIPAGLRLPSLERSASKVGPQLAFGNLDFQTTTPRTNKSDPHA